MIQWFKKEGYEENVQSGKDTVERELKRLRIQFNELFRPEWIEILLKKYTPTDIFNGNSEDLIEYCGKKVSRESIIELAKLNKEGKLSDAELDKAHARFKGIYRHVLENVIEADLEESESETPA